MAYAFFLPDIMTLSKLITLYSPLCAASLLSGCHSAAVSSSHSNAVEGLPTVASTLEAKHPAQKFAVEKGTFLLHGEPYTIRAAELHYPRIPRPYWLHRIRQVKALGMNTVCLYVFWNLHEEQPDTYDFSDQRDLRQFILLCQQEGLNVILRPGPYVCAEWEMGGLPWWLLRKEDIRLRESDPYFLERTEKFMSKVADQTSDLLATHGGPIIMVQVENEYGSYATNKEYVSQIRDIVRRQFGAEVTLFQCDWSSNFQNNALPDLLWTMNFGTGADIDKQFADLRRLRPDAPLMCSEFWSGWFDKWGAEHETRPATLMIEGIEEMLSKNISFSLYMTHGGTNWGHWAGANSPSYAPDVTSYDYDAPISESGGITPKYRLLRKALSKYYPGGEEGMPPIPDSIPVMSLPEIDFTEVGPLFANLPEAKTDTAPHPIEHYGQGFGSVIYSTTIPSLPQGGTLRITDVHDYAQVFLDGKYVGSLDRRLDQNTITLPAHKGGRLDILVECMGRVNFSHTIYDRKGITHDVVLTTREGRHTITHPLTQWAVYNLEDTYPTYSDMHFQSLSLPASTALSASTPLSASTEGEHNGNIEHSAHRGVGGYNDASDSRGVRGVYRAHFDITGTPADTFLDLSTWGKGLVYVNGIGIGRFWEIGPQQTLYLPGCWLKEGENEIIIFDIIGPTSATTRGLTTPILDDLRQSSGRRSDANQLGEQQK